MTVNTDPANPVLPGRKRVLSSPGSSCPENVCMGGRQGFAEPGGQLMWGTVTWVRAQSPELV